MGVTAHILFVLFLHTLVALLIPLPIPLLKEFITLCIAIPIYIYKPQHITEIGGILETAAQQITKYVCTLSSTRRKVQLIERKMLANTETGMEKKKKESNRNDNKQGKSAAYANETQTEEEAIDVDIDREQKQKSDKELQKQHSIHTTAPFHLFQTQHSDMAIQCSLIHEIEADEKHIVSPKKNSDRQIVDLKQFLSVPSEPSTPIMMMETPPPPPPPPLPPPPPKLGSFRPARTRKLEITTTEIPLQGSDDTLWHALSESRSSIVSDIIPAREFDISFRKTNSELKSMPSLTSISSASSSPKRPSAQLSHSRVYQLDLLMRSFGARATPEKIGEALMELDSSLFEAAQPSELMKLLPREGEVEKLSLADELQLPEQTLLHVSKIADLEVRIRGIQYLLEAAEREKDAASLCYKVKKCVGMLYQNDNLAIILRTVAELIAAVNDASHVEAFNPLHLTKFAEYKASLPLPSIPSSNASSQPGTTTRHTLMHVLVYLIATKYGPEMGNWYPDLPSAQLETLAHSAVLSDIAITINWFQSMHQHISRIQETPSRDTMLHDCKLRLTNVKRLRDEAEQTCGDLLSWLGLKGDSQDAHDIIQAIVDFGRRYVTIFKEMYPPQYRPKKTITHKISNQELSSKRSPSATRNKNNALSPGWSARPKISSPLKISRQQIQCNRLRGKSINSILKAHVNSLPGSPKEDQPMMSTTDMEILMT